MRIFASVFRKNSHSHKKSLSESVFFDLVLASGPDLSLCDGKICKSSVLLESWWFPGSAESGYLDYFYIYSALIVQCNYLCIHMLPAYLYFSSFEIVFCNFGIFSFLFVIIYHLSYSGLYDELHIFVSRK